MKIKSLFESKFIKVFDLQYQEGRHYYNATRRDEEDLVAAKSTEEFKKMLPDAVSCVVTVSYTHLDCFIVYFHSFPLLSCFSLL